MDVSIFYVWMSPFPILGVFGVLLIFYSISNMLANSEDTFQAFDLSLHCLHVSQKWDASLILVKLRKKWREKVLFIAHRINLCHL